MTAIWEGPTGLGDDLAPISELRPFPGNARRGHLPTIVESLQIHGQYRAVVANRRTNEVLAGNHTLAAARQLGWSHLAVTWVDVDEDEARKIVLVDNRSNDQAGYDVDELLSLLEQVESLDGTGFDALAVQELQPEDPEEPTALNDPDDVPDTPAAPVSKPGDVWVLGPHRLLCGDATRPGPVLDVLDGERADCVWTDPPYGVSYTGRTKDHLTIANDGKADLPLLLPAAFRTAVGCSKPGAPVYIAHADTERLVFEQSMVAAGMLVRQNLVWVKNAIVLGRSDYHYRHEPILEAETPTDSADLDDEDASVAVTHDPVLYGFTPGSKKGRLGRGGRRWYGDNRQSTVFEIPKPKRSAVHPTMKPVELVQRMLANSCPRGGLVLDLFGGSGSTLIAAHHHGSRALLVELDPKYADVICRRWQEHTGVTPVLQRSGKSADFDFGAVT